MTDLTAIDLTKPVQVYRNLHKITNNEQGQTTMATTKLMSGPFTKSPSGKFNDSGEPVMRKCSPYWVVRTMTGKSSSILQDVRFFSAASAKAFCAAR